MRERNKVIVCNQLHILVFKKLFIYILVICLSACKDDDLTIENPGKYNGLGGTLLYSGGSNMLRFDFSSGNETLLFADGRNYAVAQNGHAFVWYSSDPFSGTTTMQIHDTRNPADYKTITLDLIIDTTPKITSNTGLLGALTASVEEPYRRKDLLFFDSEGNKVGWLYNVKDFCFTPNGKDVIVSVEVKNENEQRYGVVLIKDFQSQTSQSILIHEYPDYELLPVSITVSPDGTMLAFTHLEHIFTMPLQEGAAQRQITTSSLHEINASFSPDGKYLAFTHYAVNNCGRIMIVPVTDSDHPVTINAGIDSDPENPFPLLLKSSDDLYLATCGGNGIIWVESNTL